MPFSEKHKCICLCIFVWHFVRSNHHCGKFHIESPNAKDGIFVEEHETVNITFRLTNSNCKMIPGIRIDVSKMADGATADSSIFIPQCTIWHEDNHCGGSKYNDIICTCLHPIKTFIFSIVKNVSASDITKWKLSTADIEAEDAIIDFMIAAKTTVTSAAIGKEYREVTSIVDITETTHPPTSTRPTTRITRTIFVYSDTSWLVTKAENILTSNTENSEKHVTFAIIYLVGGAIFLVVVIVIIICVIVVKIHWKERKSTRWRNDEPVNGHLNSPASGENSYRSPRCIELGPNVEAMLFVKGCTGTSTNMYNMSEGYSKPDLTLVPRQSHDYADIEEN